MGRNSGGVTSSGSKGKTAYQKATDALYSAFQANNKAGIESAAKRLSGLISKQSDAIVKERSISFSDAAYWSHKSRNPKSEYNASAYNYNKKLSSLYAKEVKKRKL